MGRSHLSPHAGVRRTLTFEDKIVRDLAVRIPAIRAARGWSQERLAEESGIHRTYLGGIEAARRNPSLRNLIRLA
ncbi:MAG: helix-turn-helix transcriptional regulator [Bryobacteraceae bacterium]